MLELQVYAPGLRVPGKMLEFDHRFESVPGLRYKVDACHDIVYIEFDRPNINLQDIRKLFRQIDLEPRFIGNIPPELGLRPKTERIDELL